MAIAGDDEQLERFQRIDWLPIALILAWGLWHLAPHLAHTTIRDWDEAFHQAAARGAYDSFFFPHLFADPLYPVDPRYWWASQVWLHKPPAPLWFAAGVMHLIGVTPLALRLGGLLGLLGGAVGLYLLVRTLAGRVWATVGAMGFLSLPASWIFVQGYFFGDAYDCTLVGWVTLSMVLLLWAVHQRSWRWMAVAGFATGVGHLVKTVLALAPLGVATVLCALGALGFCRGPKLRGLLAMIAGWFVVAAPWNLYAAARWPDVFFTGAKLTFGHISSTSGVDVAGWGRPFDAILNEVNAFELNPLPVILGVLALGALTVRAVRRREFVVTGVTLWLGATWLVHSYVHVKAPGHVWNSVTAVFAALALIAADVWRSPPLAAATLGALGTPWLIQELPWLARVRERVPELFVQTRVLPGLAEGLFVVVILTGAVWVASRWWGKRDWFRLPLGFAASGALVYALLIWTPRAQAAALEARRDGLETSYSRELGLALDRQLPLRSVLFAPAPIDPPGVLEGHNLMFWSGRMVYRAPPDVATAHAHGYHPFLASSLAEPFAPVPNIPAHAWTRAFDLDVPAGPPPLPEGVHPVEATVDGMRVLGWAAGRIDSEHDRYALYLHSDGPPGRMEVTWVTAQGPQTVGLEPELTLHSRGQLAGVAWFILPFVGPPQAALRELVLGSSRFPLLGPQSRLPADSGVP